MCRGASTTQVESPSGPESQVLYVASAETARVFSKGWEGGRERQQGRLLLLREVLA